MSDLPIENHGVIGDLSTVALVGTDGSIDFMCLPEFDSPSVFAALLDDRCGGRFQLAPLLEGAPEKQLYLPDTCVLLTRFLASSRPVSRRCASARSSPAGPSGMSTRSCTEDDCVKAGA
jgi:GH15 family glucan-1,4-alpha-glucosidase